MNKNKESFIKSLTLAINALKNDIVHYNWDDRHSCNMGVLAQVMLETDMDGIREMSNTLFDGFNALNAPLKRGDDDWVPQTWKNAIQRFCPITGKSVHSIIKQLEQAGLTREDMVHLEYLENEAILAGSDIQKVARHKQTQIGIVKTEKTVPSKNLFLALLGKKTTVVEQIPQYKEEVVYEYPENYYTKKENLIKYLVSWVKILTTDVNENVSLETTKQKLEAQLLNAIAEESYEAAASLRDQIALI